MSDDFRLYRGPGWIGVILTSFFTSCAVLIAFLLGVQQGFLRVPAFEAKADTEKAEAGPHVAVPSLLGLSATTARELLEARGLRFVVQKKRPHTAQADTVIGQEPLADSMLPRNSQVVVVLSTGTPPTRTVPELTGKPLGEALKALHEAELNVSESVKNADPQRLVTGSEPSAGSSVERGSSVELLLAPQQIEVPKLIGSPLAKAKEELSTLGLSLGRVRSRYDEDRGAYIVLNQTPAPGTLVDPKSRVDLVYNEE